MIEIRRDPIRGAAPRKEQFGALVLDWYVVQGMTEKPRWACVVQDADAQTADAWVKAFGARWNAEMREVSAPPVPQVTPSARVPDNTVRRVYDALIEAGGDAVLSSLLSGAGLPSKPAVLPAWVNAVPPEVVDYLQAGVPWAEAVRIWSGQPTVTVAPAVDESAAPEAETSEDAATPADASGYGTPEQVAAAVVVIRALYAESDGKAPSGQKVASRLKSNGLPAAGSHLDALTRLAKE